MKLTLLSACLLIATFVAKAQSNNAILFTENGERFQVILNGILQNPAPETNVKMTGLVAPQYKARIIFEDKALGYLDFNMFFPEPPQEVTWNVKKNNKGQYVTRAVSWIPVAQAPPPPPTQTVVVYSATPPPAAVSSTTVQQTTTTTSGNPDNVSINMGVNMGDQGGGINMNVSGMNGTSSSTTTTTTTHSTTVTTNDPPPPQPVTQVVYVEGYNGNVGCPRPMSHGDFDSFKSSVSSKSFEDSKLTIAKQVLNNNCLTSAQVREVMKLFTFEDSRLDFAKYAYGHTYDINNYYKVNDAFTFESSIDDLNNYIKSYQR